MKVPFDEKLDVRNVNSQRHHHVCDKEASVGVPFGGQDDVWDVSR